ncbi:MAG: hypothetical protein HN956_00240, partial [Rhodospirillaceae bacterium]|nr:hypothetical protein [Rhodospirillaceae bacterium]
KRIIMENIIPLYKSLRDEENRHENRKDGMNAAYDMVGALLADKGVGYDEFVATL